ncbi:hypothetical protein [Streptomyces sp. URMC 129]|uniref:hypothetical protein n=1 Tax=Streptomyces sp. URMC 129 TaxID=3423407 RepID=UPI003F1961BF
MIDLESMRAAEQAPVTEAGGPSADIRVAVEFSVSPGGPPDVALAPDGATGYPGVRVKQADADGTVLPQDVYVALPRGKRLRFAAEGGSDYLLTVRDSRGTEKTHRGILSSDGQALTFENVDLALSGKGSTATAWVAVKASDTARPGSTHLLFCVGDRTSGSTTIRVVDHIPFSVAPGGPPDVILKPAGGTGYPGVRLRADDDGTVAPQDVYVALPRGRGLRFAAEGGTGCLLTVRDARQVEKTYRGTLSSDGQGLTFQGVDPALSGKGSTSLAWVAVKASDTAPASEDPITLTFCVGDRPSGSTPIHVDPGAG